MTTTEKTIRAIFMTFIIICGIAIIIKASKAKTDLYGANNIETVQTYIC